MKKRIYNILFLMLLCLVGGAEMLRADDIVVVMYVKPNGSFDKDGSSWADAKNNLQNAIDILSENDDVRNGRKKGYIYVAGSEDDGATSYSATYYPTRRSTDDADGNTVNTSFRINAGIYVYGGFKGTETIPNPGDANYKYCDSIHELWKLRELSTGIVYGKLMEMHDDGELDDTRSWDFKYKSILSGNHHVSNYTFTYDSKRGVYNTVFPLSSYHVVWFGTNGKIDPTAGVDEYEPNIDEEDAADDPVVEVNNIYYLLNTKANTAIVTKKPNGLYTGSISIPGSIDVGTGKDKVTYKVTGIRNGAFAGCEGVTEVTIAKNVTSIGQAAFYGCKNMTALTLPATLTHIYRYAFQGCKSLTSVTFQKNIKLIDRWAFSDCSSLSTVDIPSSINYIGRYAFKNTALPANTVLPNYEKEEESMTGRFKGLPFKAIVSGFTIEGGNACSNNLQGHDHTSFGGGAYLVRNARIEDCIIHHCSATQRGGGIYLDGGGDVNYCYVHTCQATGFGMQQGYGGGICIDYDGEVEHCYVVQCAARAGGGLAICHDPNDYPEEAAVKQDETFYDAYKDNEDIEASCYDPFCKATIISNCTSNAEGGGVYLNYGGSLDHVTVVNNECIGPDVIYYGMRHGRTGGIYVREAGAIYNSVAWGNKCGVNNDIQFAAFKKEDYYDITIDHSAFSKGEITDWASVIRNAVINLNDVNFPTASFSSGNFPMFAQPTVSAGIMHNAGVVDTTALTGQVAGKAYQDAYNWHPLGMSSMRGKGKQIVDVTVATRAELLHANADRDVLGIKFESVSVCGAVTNTYHEVKFALMTSLERQEGRTDGESEPIPTLFVDPSKVATSATNTDDGKVGYQEDQALGASWKHPLNNLQDAVYFFSQALNEDKILQKYKKKDLTANPDLLNNINLTKDQYAARPDSTYYLLPELNDDGTIKIVDDKIVYKKYRHVQILVKEGTMNVAGRGAYLTGHIRTASVRPTSNMRLYGGYPSTSSETTITGRNPRKFDSDVKADVTGGEFNDHSVHVFSIANHHDVIIDGFRLLGGNGNIASPPKGTENTPAAQEEWQFYNSVSNGGGLAMNNSREEFPRDMTGNILRNCVIANCAAPTGAALFVNGITDHISGEDRWVDPADESKGTMKACRAELTVVNTIIRNCTAGDTYDDPDKFLDKPGTMNITLEGVVVANGQGANIVVRNSDVVNNCGFPFKCEPIAEISTPFDPNGISETTTAGHIQVYNSVIFSNGLRAHAERDSINSTVFCPKESWYNVSGEYIYMGYDVLFPSDLVATHADKNIFRVLTHKKAEEGTDKYWRINDGSQQGKAVTDDSEEAEKTANRVRVRYPYFVNPSRNVGHSTTDDKSLYGGAISYEPLPTNPIVNAANPEDTKDDGMGINASGKVCMKYDMALETRSYGGDPDIGAIETTRLPKDGAVIYVTPTGAGRHDGSSWGNAIAGNTVYRISTIEGPELATGHSIDPVTTCDRVLDGSGHPVLTTNELYCGGFGKVWFTDKKVGAVSTSVESTIYTTETHVYTGGPNPRTVVERDGTVPVVKATSDISSAGSTEVGFVAGYAYDSRYPYGEISGASRSFWRANPHKTGTTWACDYGSMSDFITACNNATTGFIKNSRAEKYVGGLQYAVETAAATNATKWAAYASAIGELSDEEEIKAYPLPDTVQVWVSNGIYTDYKGFVMRDRTTVMGGFPARDGGTPGLDERQALMSNVINIPKSLPAKDLNPDEYETVLQISDVDPKEDNETLKSAAIKFWDDDYKLTVSTDNYTSQRVDSTITKYFVWDDIEEVTNTYVRYPDMVKGSANVFAKGNRHKRPNGANNIVAQTDGEEEGGVLWNLGSKRVSQYFGDQGGGNKSWELVYEDRGNNVDYNSFEYNGNYTAVDETGATIEPRTGAKCMKLQGALLKMSVWQTFKNVPKGKYRVQVDLAAFYQKDKAEPNTGVTVYLINANGEFVSASVYSNNTSTYKLTRYELEIDQPAAGGDLTLRVMAVPGAKGEDNGDIPAIKDNPRARELLMSNVHLKRYLDNPTYVFDYKTETGTPTPTGSSSTTRYIYDPQNHRTSLRKRVLTMPDVCVPTYGAGRAGGNPATNDGKWGDDLCHTDRVTGPTKAKRTSTTFTKYEDPNYVEYSRVSWDGFTIRHGFIKDERMAQGGGAGVNMYEGAHLRNCIVINNMSSCAAVKGGGMFCDGATSTIEGCFVLDNTSTKNANVQQAQIFAGGLFMYEGTCFNSLFAKNYSYGSAGGVGFCVGNFYNNTIAYNTCSLVENGHINGGAISIATISNPNLFVANTIIFGNNGMAIRQRYDKEIGINEINPFIHCFVQTEVPFTQNLYLKNIGNYSDNSSNYGIGNVFLNGPENDGIPSVDNTPFEADVEGGSYDSENPRAKQTNNFRLLNTLPHCINKGTEDFAGTLYQALIYKGKNDGQIKAMTVYKNVLNAQLPDNDVAYANRIQDCRIDMGAYEYDGTRSIEPTLYPAEKKAIFYVTEDGFGTASARNPSDAACAVKLQKVLDAAGRWRYASYKYDASPNSSDENYDSTQVKNNFKKTVLQSELDDANFRKLKAENPSIVGETLDAVLEAMCRDEYADELEAMQDDEAPIPEEDRQTAEQKRQTLIDNYISAHKAEYYKNELPLLQEYEVIVRLEGNVNDGTPKWEPFYYTPTRNVNSAMGSENILMYSLIVPHGVRVEGGYDVTFVQPRDILGRPSYLDGIITESGGKVYHVVTFTNDLYTEEEELFTNGNVTLRNQLKFLSDTARYYVAPELKSVDGEDDAYDWTEYDDDGGAMWKKMFPDKKDDPVALAKAIADKKEEIVGDYNKSKLAEATASAQALVENNRAVLNGIFLQNGNANGSEAAQQNGAGAIVTDFAHISNCVVQDNQAMGCGGGLYLDTLALVSGCIIKNNSAKYGGGIYVYEPENLVSSGALDDPTKAPFVHVISSTIVGNDASVSAGGLYFSTNIRANSIVVWSNNANQNPNVAGTDATGKTQLVENYPLNYSGVESRRMAGVNNIELPAADSAGVRWNGGMPYEFVGEGAGANGQNYFPITLASVLTRTGMSYSAYREYMSKYPTLDTTDIFGLNRMEQTRENEYLTLAGGGRFDKETKNNIFIEMGARVLNANFEVKLNFEHIMRRLFVTTTERLPTKEAVALQSNTLDYEKLVRGEAKWKSLSEANQAALLAATTEEAIKPIIGNDYWTNLSAAGKDSIKRTDLTTEDMCKVLGSAAWNMLTSDQRATIKSDMEMYKQMGSTFRNPFLRLGDALDYIIRVRKSDERHMVAGHEVEIGDYYKDQRFEIFVCGGTFYPFRDAYGNQVESRANTFLVPEEVTIVGGIKHEADGRSYCQEGHPADTTAAGVPVYRESVTVAGYKLDGLPTYDIRMTREYMDRNGNNVEEPWELEEQTILSGVAVQNDAKSNVYHVITCLSNEKQIGKLPTRWSKDGPARTETDTLPRLFQGNISPGNPGYTGTLLENLEAETQASKDARTIIIDGVTITGGFANQIDNKEMEKNGQKLTYFRGGGILVEGNWDVSFEAKSDLPEVLGVAKRDIPVIISSCLIKDNLAGNGGGVYTNGTFYSFGCHFTANRSKGPITADDQELIPWVAGGAIANNYHLFVCNTLFDNNEALAGLEIKSKAVHNANDRQGYAGAISCSETGLLRIGNCDFVRNKAVAFPAIYNFIDNNLRSVSSLIPEGQRTTNVNYFGRGWHFALNTIFWGNEASGQTIAYANDLETEHYSADVLNNDMREPDHVANFGPLMDVATLTFCAYQEGTGREGTVWQGNHDNAKGAPVKPKTYNKDTPQEYTLDGLTRLYAGDFNDVLEDYFGYYPEGHPETPFVVMKGDDPFPCAPTNPNAKILQANGVPRAVTAEDLANPIAYNYNLVLSTENTAAKGPFFVQPSLAAGYDGYMETANWLVSRLNNTIDTGWGFLKQHVTQTDETSGLYDTKLLKTAKDSLNKVILDGEDEILVPVGYYLYTEEVPTGVGDAKKTVPVKAANRFKREKKDKSTGEVVSEEIYGDADTILVPMGKKIVLADGTTINDAANFSWVQVSQYDKKDKETEIDYTYTIYRKQWNTADSIFAHDADVEEQYHDLYGEGMYNLHSKAMHLRFHHLGYPNLLPIGEEHYMMYTHEGDTKRMNMRRISTHPKMGVQDVYIDMGIYEYQYVQLVTSGDETDVLWVAENTAGKGNGSTCKDATSDLQWAIETLLLSRNDHDKMIKLVTGNYWPQPTVNSKNKAFYIDVPSRTDGVTLPKTLTADETHSVKSLTIKGGYPDFVDRTNDGELYRDIEAYPTVLEMHDDHGNNSGQALAHLFIIQDAEEKGCYMNYLTDNNKDFKDNVMPIVFDGLTFTNPYGGNPAEGGAAILYKEQYQKDEPTTGSNEFVELTDHLLKPVTYTDPDETVVDTVVPKLLIKNCIIKASGNTEGVSAVKIMKGGGPALIVNTLFHSNSGDPLDAVNTRLVNCTFALNGGHVNLTDETEEYYKPKDWPEGKPAPSASYPSYMYNSIIWRDDEAQTNPELKKQWSGVLNLGTNMKYNAYTSWVWDGETGKGDWNRPTSLTVEDANHNILLDTLNRSVFYGPNFVAPKEKFADGMTEQQIIDQKLERDFHISPSARLINKADSSLYRKSVPFYAEHSVIKEITVEENGVSQEPYIFQSVQRLDRPMTIDAATYYPKFMTGKYMKGTEEAADLTPYDAPCPYRWTTYTVEKWPKKAEKEITTVSSTRPFYREVDLTGSRYTTRWDGAGMERGAYECAAAVQRVLYVSKDAVETFDGSSWAHAFRRDELQNAIDVASIYSTIKGTPERAYVFVRADAYVDKEIYIRDGVSVFGGLNSRFTALANKTEGVYTDDDVNDYVNLVNASRDPIAAPNAPYSEIIGLRSDNEEAPVLGFTIDGFVLKATGENRPSSVDETPFVVDKHLTVIKNCIITGNNVMNDKPVLKMSKGLLYNSLVYGNNASTVVEITNSADEEKAGVLNCTVVADNAGETAIASAVTGSVVNTITFNEASKSIGRNAESTAFVKCNTGTDMFAPYLTTANDYTLPTYLTGNRPLHYQLKETATGYINNGQDTTTTMASSIFHPYGEFINYADVDGPAEGISGLAGDRDPLGNPRLRDGTPDIGCFETWYVTGNKYITNETATDYSTNYGGHIYPHEGSVLYVMSGANLVVNIGDNPATLGDVETDYPLFTGNPLVPGYVLVKDGGSIYGQGNPLHFDYVAAERNFSAQRYALVSLPFDIRHKDPTIQAYSYSGETRSTYNYQFLNENSTAWVAAPALITANEGWLADFGESFTGTKRFTGWGLEESQYAYTEDGSDKSVTLTQYDHRTAGSGSSLDFTRQEDMGWNLKGLPYLVSGYRTDDYEVDDQFRMDIPHVFYKDNASGYLNNSTVATLQSWNKTEEPTLSPGYGFFTQTAAIGAEEELFFTLPLYKGETPTLAKARPVVLMRDLNNEGDLLTVNPDVDAPKTINYSFGRDGVKWLMSDAPQLYMLSASNSRLSLVGAAPTEVDLPLGVYIPNTKLSNDSINENIVNDQIVNTFTFSLPEPEAYEPYQYVWLIDRGANHVTNLLENDYTTTVESGTNHSRFQLRIGGVPFGTTDRREYIVFAYKQQLFIRGLMEGDIIRIYSAGGQLILNTVATAEEFTTTLPQTGGIYAVQVNDFSKKVRNL